MIQADVASLNFAPEVLIAFDETHSKPIIACLLMAITSIPRLIGVAAIEGKPDHLPDWEVRRSDGRSARSPAITVLPVGALGGPPYHSATAKK
jgi:hypothetical protein